MPCKHGKHYRGSPQGAKIKLMPPATQRGERDADGQEIALGYSGPDPFGGTQVVMSRAGSLWNPFVSISHPGYR